MKTEDYFVLSPFEPLTESEFIARKKELAKEGRKVIAVVFNCKDYNDFSRKYFGER